jgi:hypothetical protein
MHLSLQVTHSVGAEPTSSERESPAAASLPGYSASNKRQAKLRNLFICREQQRRHANRVSEGDSRLHLRSLRETHTQAKGKKISAAPERETRVLDGRKYKKGKRLRLLKQKTRKVLEYSWRRA